MSDDPLMRNDTLRALREVLARKIYIVEDSRKFAVDAGLDPVHIAFHSRADLNWFAILEEARNQGPRRVRALVDLAIKRFPDDESLTRLRDGGPVRYAEGPDLAALPWHGRGGHTLEKLLGKESALVPVSFLEIGMLRARAVARLAGADGWLASGFLIAGDLLVTNHHVIRDREAARAAVAQFNVQKTASGADAGMESLALDPDAFFTTSVADDCTIVKVQGEPSSRWGALDLAPLAPSSLCAEDRVNIIQHPAGGHKQLSFFHNLVVYVGNGRVQYLTDTLPGSSGSPVFDKEWRLVALHHSGGWIPEPGSREHFYRNEGIHVDRLLALLHAGPRAA